MLIFDCVFKGEMWLRINVQLRLKTISVRSKSSQSFIVCYNILV